MDQGERRCCSASEDAVHLDRRTFLSASGLAAGALVATSRGFPAFLQDPADAVTVPADKGLDRAWIRALFARGEPERWRGEELRWIGMPVGGICAGQLYLGGDGRLWHWDVFRSDDTTDYAGTSRGPHYAEPMRPASPLEQGFALRVRSGGKTRVRALDGRGFAEIEFHGRYPVGDVRYRDAGCPVGVDLRAFSPFLPLAEEDSGFPATLLEYTLRNDGDARCDVELAGWIENLVCPGQSLPVLGTRRHRAVRGANLAAVVGSAEDPPERAAAETREDLLIADFESERYEKWTAEGEAFGAAPFARADMAPYHDVREHQGERVANSHNTRVTGPDSAAADRLLGTLTSDAFRVRRRYLSFLVSGGSHAGATEIQLLVDGEVVRTATGRNSNRMHWQHWSVAELEGRRARIRLVDSHQGAWGHIGADHFLQTDAPRLDAEVAGLPGFGSLALGLLDAGGEAEIVVRLEGLDASVAPGELPADAVFAALDRSARAGTDPGAAASAREAVAPFGSRLVGAVSRRLVLEPGAEARLRFAVAWHFPGYAVRPFGAEMSSLAAGRPLRRHYSRRWDSALAVLRDLAHRGTALAETTMRWSETWYDSSLPHWLLDRSFVNVSTLATQTCHRFDDGRFWAWEGVYCCPGTCQHVWQYAQSVARVFPALERDTRERVDLGLAWHESGAQDYRAENARHVAHDGLAGTLLRVYREHQMSADESWLRALWPRVRRSVEFLLAEDRDEDGLLEGAQYNTLDNTWYGPMAWLSSLFLAAVEAGRAMAEDLGDAEFATRCAERVARGRRSLVERLFNGEYFVHEPDPAHPEATNTNRGCHIDQLLGQSWAWQLGLGRIAPPTESRAALQSLWRYNFAPDVGAYREQAERFIPGGRWYALPGERGLLMCAWPRGGIAEAPGRGQPDWAVAYFNECMSGFEYQVAAHMIWEGLVQEGLAVARAIHDRYHPAKRNPFNEIECSDHYARAMASHGVFLAACGFEYHGPRGHLGFAPRLRPEDFRAAFIAAEGWGSFAQQRDERTLRARVELRWGRMELRSLSLEVPEEWNGVVATAAAGERGIAVEVSREGARVTARFDHRLRLEAGATLELRIERSA